MLEDNILEDMNEDELIAYVHLLHNILEANDEYIDSLRREIEILRDANNIQHTVQIDERLVGTRNREFAEFKNACEVAYHRKYGGSVNVK